MCDGMWCDRGIAVGGVQSLLRGLRIIVEMNEIMRHARMPLLTLRDRLQNCGAFALLGISLVIGVSGGIERDRVSNLRLVVLWILRGDLLLRVAERADALDMAELVIVGIHEHQRVDVLAFALALGAHHLGFLNRGEARREIGPRNRIMRIVEQRECETPLRHGARRVGL
jgi:hypothetical protein